MEGWAQGIRITRDKNKVGCQKGNKSVALKPKSSYQNIFEFK